VELHPGWKSAQIVGSHLPCLVKEYLLVHISFLLTLDQLQQSYSQKMTIHVPVSDHHDLPGFVAHWNWVHLSSSHSNFAVLDQ
jgi:hypothetical protein